MCSSKTRELIFHARAHSRNEKIMHNQLKITKLLFNIYYTCMPSPKVQLVSCSQILEDGACDKDIRVWMHGHMVVAFWACYLHCLRDRKQCVSLFRTTMRTPHIHVHKRGIGSANCTIRLYEHFYNRACQ